MTSEQYNRLHEDLKEIKSLATDGMSNTSNFQRAQLNHHSVFRLTSILQRLLYKWEVEQQQPKQRTK